MTDAETATLERSRLWTWARIKYGNDLCNQIQQSCETFTSADGTECLCGYALAMLVALEIATT